MKGKGLTMDVIVEAASALVVEKGYNNFSVRELAQVLHVKAASLYNHISSVDDVNREVGKLASRKLNERLEEVTRGIEKDEAIEALSYAYRDFVKDNYELYRSVIGLPALDAPEQGDGLKAVGRESIRVIRHVVHQYEISEEEAVHFSRCLRSVLHGFVSLEMAGYFTGRMIRSEDSFRFMVDGYIGWVNGLEKRQENR